MQVRPRNGEHEHESSTPKDPPITPSTKQIKLPPDMLLQHQMPEAQMHKMLLLAKIPRMLKAQLHKMPGVLEAELHEMLVLAKMLEA